MTRSGDRHFVPEHILVTKKNALTICSRGTATSLSIVRCVPSLENWNANR